MKTPLNSLLSTTIAVVIAAACSTAHDAWADCNAFVDYDAFAYLIPSDGSSAEYDLYGATITNQTFQVGDSFKWVQTFGGGDSGAFGYYDLERKFDGANVSYVMRIANAYIDAPFTDNSSGYAYSGGGGSLTIQEDMMLVYLPSSATDTPPTQVSFQISYSLLGQYYFQNEGQGQGQGSAVNATPPAFGSGESEFEVYASLGVSTPVSSQILSPVYTYPINTVFTPNLNLIQGGSDNWGSDYLNNTVPSTLDVRYILNGFVNIVDQNGQPIPPGKLQFEYYNQSNPSNSIPIPNPANLSGSQAIALSPITSANGLVLQWPAYATDYQLETSTTLANGSWTTNTLPTAVQSGPFLQVTIPTTNSSAFFRLLQTD